MYFNGAVNIHGIGSILLCSRCSFPGSYATKIPLHQNVGHEACITSFKATLDMSVKDLEVLEIPFSS